MVFQKVISASQNFEAYFTKPGQRFGKWYTMEDYPNHYEMADERFGIEKK